MSTSHSQGRL
ncbi:hypothetical protein WJX79_005497 [Trebouxia sp. C0005]